MYFFTGLFFFQKEIMGCELDRTTKLFRNINEKKSYKKNLSYLLAFITVLNHGSLPAKNLVLK